MTLNEAIEILQYHSTAGAPNLTLAEIDAIKLGIEALKQIKRSRDKRFPIMGEELPGETAS